MSNIHCNYYFIHNSFEMLNDHLARGLPSACLVFLNYI